MGGNLDQIFLSPWKGSIGDPRWSPESTGPSRAGFKAVPNQGEAWRWRRRAWRRSRSLPLSNGPPAGPFDGGESRLPLRLLLLLPMPVLGLGPALALNCGRRFFGGSLGQDWLMRYSLAFPKQKNQKRPGQGPGEGLGKGFTRFLGAKI